MQFLIPIFIVMLYGKYFFEAFQNQIELGSINKKYWKGRLWYLVKNFDEDENVISLKSMDLSGKFEIRKEARLIGKYAKIIPDEENLWLISDDIVYTYKNKKLLTLGSNISLEEASEPFIYRGKLSIINKTDSSDYGIYIFKDY